MKSFLSHVCGNLLDLNARALKNMPSSLGIRFSAVGAGFLCAEMPVNERSRQAHGVLHGGASAVLAETVGSAASWLLSNEVHDTLVAGVEINCSHLRAVRSGKVHAVCKPLKIGRSLHFWRIDIYDDAGNHCCASRLTVSIGGRTVKMRSKKA